MVLNFCIAAWNITLFIIFVVFPIAFIYGLVKETTKIKKEEQSEEEISIPAMPTNDLPLGDTYKTIKREPGSYLVVSSDKTEAHVLKVETPAEGKYWIAVLVKNNTKSERVSTKKEAVALAIELLKDYKEANNGS